MKASRAAARTWLIVLCGTLLPAVGWSQSAEPRRREISNVEFDPIRCWWRTSAGAVRTGQTFSVTLTCAVLDTETARVIPDETKLDASVIQMLHFEVVGGTHPPDLRDRQRRFFQYEYTLRAIDPDLIGQDVSLPNLQVQYRVSSRLPGKAAQEGRELSYLLPPQRIRVVSMVPEDTADIRDTSNQPFGRVEPLLSRARILDLVAVTLGGLGSVMAVLALVGLVGRGRSKVEPSRRRLTGHAIAGLVTRDLSEVQREAEREGWSDGLVSRALAATRVAAACALERPISQRPAEVGSQPPDGCLLLRSGMRRRGATTAISSCITAADVAQAINRLPDAAPPARRQMFDDFREALATFAKAQYGRQAERDRQSLDGAAAAVAASARELRTGRRWPGEALRRWITRPPAPERRS